MIGFLIGLTGVLAGSSAGAGPPLVSANPNKVECLTLPPPQGCSCDPEPLPQIAGSPNFDANSYHINSDCKLQAVLAFPDHEKPKIVSDDANNDVKDIIDWIGMVAGAEEHYEHYDGPLGNCALAGQIIDGLEDFPQDSRDVLRELQKHVTKNLSANGTLTRSGREFYWSDRSEPITLMGFGWPGALASLNFDIDGYLDVLASYDVNLTRVFSIDQWTALATGCQRPDPDDDTCPEPDICLDPNRPFCTYAAAGDDCKNIILGNGHTPFSGTFSSQWDLSRLNILYFRRLIQFVEAAADRGIVVQLSLFDRHGLKNLDLDDPSVPDNAKSRKYGWWLGSPYNLDNNENGFLAPGDPGEVPPGFLGQDTTDVGAVNSCFITTVAQQLASYGNVILEIMNEPKVELWPDENIVDWHEWVADRVRNGTCDNQPPHAVDDADDDAFTTPQDTFLNISFDDLLANDTDPDPGDTVYGPFWLSPQVTSQGGTLGWHLGVIVYSPPPGFVGEDSFEYTITDRLDSECCVNDECCGLVDNGTVTITVTPVADPPVPVQMGTATIGKLGATVILSGFTDPKAVIGSPSFNDTDPSVTRFSRISASSFTHLLQEWDYLDGEHSNETAGYLALEAGTSTLGDLAAEAGSASVGTGWTTVSFSQSFTNAPVVLTQVVTSSTKARVLGPAPQPPAVAVRVRNVTNSSFQVRLQEEEAADGVHNNETVHYIAIAAGTTNVDGRQLVVGTSGDEVTHSFSVINFGTTVTNPVFVAGAQTTDGGDTAAVRQRNLTPTSVEVKIEEEQSADSEVAHTTEIVGYVVISN